MKTIATPMKDLISLAEYSTDDVNEILTLAHELKSQWKDGDRPQILSGRVLTQVYEKPSLRTRNSFETAMYHLGGNGIFLTTAEAGFNGRESLGDIATVLGSYSDVIVLRTFSQQFITDVAKYARCPVINGLSDDTHPCQALTDMMTMQEVFGDISDKHLVFVGDGNNVAVSLATITSQLGVRFTVACPADFQLEQSFLDDLKAKFPNSNVTQTTDPAAAVKDADVVYTDVWASMGQEEDAARRKAAFADFQVNGELMAQAPSTCKFMHDLPAKRGLEVTDEVMDGDQSIVFQQAENRMHLAKGLFAWLLDKKV